MQTIQAVITGAVQGLSEFLPISSSAHIVFSNKLYSLVTNSGVLAHQEEIFFDILVHLATLAAVVIYFYNDLKTIIKGFFIALREKNYNSENYQLITYILITTIITGIIGLILKKPTESLIESPKIICILLFITGLVLFFSEKKYSGNEKISLKKAVLIGISQGLAIFPGFSRSGLTLACSLFQGLDRVSAARFSFLASIPVILLASLVYPLMELDFTQIANFNLKAMFLGSLTSFIVGYLCIKYFMQLISKISLKGFSYYCFIISIVMFLLFQFYYHM